MNEPKHTLLHALLHEKFGMTSFRPGQFEAIQALFSHKRLLCIQPTGYGKSLLYQLPSCLLGGITLVISPLLALMRDQIDQLSNRFHIPSASINSDQSEAENEEARTRSAQGGIQILFTSPEQLDHIDRFKFFLFLPITLLVIDEAHCISTWGHDFRPSYRCILTFSESLQEKNPNLKILALTATADKRVEADIAKQLSYDKENVHIWREKMERKNLYLRVLSANGIAEKLALCQTLLTLLHGQGLIYCATRENAELVADYLKEQRVEIICYHAGLESEVKRSIQAGFSQNQYRIIAATTALGMGIDKKDLRFIIHFDIPGSITAYYQEIGRSGRDGKKAEAILLYDKFDRKVQDYFIESALPSEADFQAVLQAVQTAVEPPNLTAIKRATGLHPTRATLVTAELLEQSFLKKESLKGVQVYSIEQQEKPLDLSRYTTQHAVKKEELEKILFYAEQKTACRMALLRRSLGDSDANACGVCDICQTYEPIHATDETGALKWLVARPVPIASTKIHRISEGFSLLDGKLRSPLFLRFMMERQENEEVDQKIMALLIALMKKLDTPIAAIAPLPSKTWKAHMQYAQALATHMNVPLLSELLSWKTPPEKRQGELLNNDQRHYNVHSRMQLTMPTTPITGAILLLDDYMGSGATMKEAARCIRKKLDNPLIPVTIASIKWRLGKSGFI